MPDINPTQLSFDEAIKYFSEKTNLDTDSWVDGQGIVQDAAFTIAAAKGNLLQDLREAVAKAQSEGKSTQDFLKVFDGIADSYSPDWMKGGNRAWRGQLIYEQNINQANKAGRYQQLMEPTTKKLRPFWQWRHGNSRDPRPSHLALDGKVFPCDELPMFPHGFNCRCQIFSLSQRDLDRKGLEVSDLQRGDYVKSINPSTGEAVAVKLEPDEGFDYTPGKSTKQQREAILKGLSPDLRRSVMGEPEAEFKLTPGTTKIKNGVAYTLIDSRWQLIEDAKEARKANIDELTLDFQTELAMTSVKMTAAEKRSIGDSYIKALMGLSDRDAAETRANVIELNDAVPRDLLYPITKDSADFFQLIDKDLPISKIIVEGDRSYASLTEDFFCLSVDSSPSYRRECLFHEAGHFTEIVDPEFAEDNYQWTQSRATGDARSLKEMCPNHSYGDDEIAFPDRFIDPYVGKFYKDPITEVASMGLENFSDGRKLVDFARKDPDHFRRIVNYIKK